VGGGLPTGKTLWNGPEEGGDRGTAMDERVTLRSHLDQAASRTPNGPAVADVIEAVAAASVELADLIADGPLAGITGRFGGINSDGDRQKDIDLAADGIMRRALRFAPVAAILSEESELPEILASEAPLCIAIDPLDGSANLENNISVGTIFSIRPRGNDVVSTFFEPGTAQCAAGFVVYGPQTTLVLALNESVDIFILDRRAREFLLVTRGARIAPNTPEFAINASNRRHWHGPVRAYIDECLAGANGNGEADFNMRWIGSLVAESLRILVRGGVFLYPADARPGYREGRLRLLYEAHPMALVMEWAGGAATTGRRRILELSARTPHQRVPLIMGSSRGVRDVAAIHEGIEPMFDNSDAPLFARRGLFR
jgi:fructose-1,6-bisphosphatase I